MTDIEKIAGLLSGKLNDNITIEMFNNDWGPAQVKGIIEAIAAEKAETPPGDKLLPSTYAIQENLELVLYAERIPAVAMILKAFFKTGVGILVTNRDPVTLAEWAGNTPFRYDLENSVKRLLLACRAGEWVSWDASKIFNYHGETPFDKFGDDLGWPSYQY